MARTVNFLKRADKIKEQVDDLVKEMSEARTIHVPARTKLKLIDIDFEEIDTVTLMQIQARLSKIILDKSKR
ncbi:hypothetical protein [Parabacteroides sp. AM08-6]|uniref:hypothetical protein n=1 Tax=Parabacteroides sp. AM08-6 TaxID=2292053 RepID=UPI000F003B29|nr:hypothetical protein [Parabacteroides sp. AM08-6]RHJ81811.1 hypothetical protein DW103_10860 [Parabacteroides sp. AM08-6]